MSPTPGIGPLFQAVLVDLDGTLVDSWPCLSRAWTRWAVTWGVTAAEFQGASGSTTRDLVSALVPAGAFPDALADIEGAEQSDTEGCHPLPGSLQVLNLPPQRVAVVTSASAQVARLRLAAANLPVPGVLVSADDVTNGKPLAEPYLLAASLLGARPQDCLVVEDSRVGVAAARAAGMSVIVVSTGPEHLREGGDLCVTSLSDITFVTQHDGVRVV